jgi:Tfp pilus assembly protein PilN
MKVPTNLATQPFRKDRPILFASGLVGLLMVVTLVLLISLALADRRRSADTRQIVRRLDKQIQHAGTEQTALDSLLRRPENAEVLDRSLFLNSLLYHKSISWTKLFADIEKVLPPNVRLINIRPQVLSESAVYLEMYVGSDAQPPVIDLLLRLESSEVFGRTTMYSSLPPSQTDPLYHYRISVNYAQKL